MNCKEMARKIKNGYNYLKRESVYKEYDIIWNRRWDIPEIYVKNDAEFKAIIIGNTGSQTEIGGFMYLFYTDDRKVPFPTIREIERRLKIVADGKILTEDDAAYFDWEKYGPLEDQRLYFSEIIKKATRI